MLQGWAGGRDLRPGCQDGKQGRLPGGGALGATALKDELFAQWGQAPIPGLPQTRGMSGRRVGPLSSFLSLGTSMMQVPRGGPELCRTEAANPGNRYAWRMFPGKLCGKAEPQGVAWVPG